MKKGAFLFLFFLPLASCAPSSIPEVTVIELSRNVAYLSVGETLQLEAKPILSDSNATLPSVSYWSSNADVASVSETGLIKAVAPGDASILAISGSKNAICRVNVAAPEEKAPETVRKGKANFTFVAPHFGLEDNLFDSEVLYYEAQNETGTSRDFYVPFGANEEKAVSNFTVVNALLKQRLSEKEPVLAEYETLKEEIAADPAKASELKNERLHLTSFYSSRFLAVTTGEKKEQARYFHTIDNDLLSSLSLIQTMGLLDLPTTSWTNLDWGRLIPSLSSSSEESVTSSSGSSVISLFAEALRALIGAFTISNKEGLTTITFTKTGLGRLTDFVSTHKEEIGITVAPEFEKAVFTIAFYDDASLKTLGTSLKFKINEDSNSIDGEMTLGEKEDASEEEHLKTLEKVSRNW